MKNKTFDSVEMKRQGAVILHEKLKDMTREEELRFWQQKTEAMQERQKMFRKRRKAS